MINNIKVDVHVVYDLHPQHDLGYFYFNYEDQSYSSRFKENIFNCDKSTVIDCDIGIISKYYLESYNGGRTNKTKYNSVEEYVSDPFTKTCYFSKLKDMFYVGNPEIVDIIMNATINGHEFEIKSHQYDVLPEIWYTECYKELGQKLEDFDVYDSYEDAMNHIKSYVDYSIFGARYFPVIKGKLTDKDVMKTLAEFSFKSSSPILFGNDCFYMGIRAKPDEINYLYKIYENGGAILKNKQWDW